MIHFERPEAFFLLLLIPVLHVLRHFKIFSPIVFFITLEDWKGEKFRWKSGFHRVASLTAKLFSIVAFVFTVAAVANPVISHQEKVYTSRGSDILFVLDTSPSMAARDIAEGTRLVAAKKSIRLLAEENGGASLGLVAMGVGAALVVPPTMDRSVFFQRLESSRVGEMGDGTAIGVGLSCAALHLEYSSAPKKIIVLITDGENNSGSVNPITAAKFLKEKGISLYVLGVGTKGMVPLEYVDPSTGKTYSGSFESNYDSVKLSSLASAAEGRFFEVRTLSELSDVLSMIGKTESVTQSYHVKNTEQSFYSACLFFSLMLFILAWFVKRVLLKEVL